MARNAIATPMINAAATRAAISERGTDGFCMSTIIKERGSLFEILEFEIAKTDGVPAHRALFG